MIDEVLPSDTLVSYAEKQLRTMVEAGVSDCRRDLLWTSLVLGLPGMSSCVTDISCVNIVEQFRELFAIWLLLLFLIAVQHIYVFSVCVCGDICTSINVYAFYMTVDLNIPFYSPPAGFGNAGLSLSDFAWLMAHAHVMPLQDKDPSLKVRYILYLFC